MSHDTFLLIVALILIAATALFIKDWTMLHVSIRASIRASSKMHQVVFGDEEESFEEHLERVPDLTVLRNSN